MGQKSRRDRQERERIYFHMFMDITTMYCACVYVYVGYVDSATVSDPERETVESSSNFDRVRDVHFCTNTLCKDMNPSLLLSAIN